MYNMSLSHNDHCKQRLDSLGVWERLLAASTSNKGLRGMPLISRDKSWNPGTVISAPTRSADGLWTPHETNVEMEWQNAKIGIWRYGLLGFPC